MPTTRPLRATPRSRARRCAYCHDDLRLPRWAHTRCAECDTALHEGCAETLACCPTLGCGEWTPLPPPWWLRLLDWALSAGILGALVSVTLYAVFALLFGSVNAVRSNAFPF
jgi:hypothetical protein